MKTILLCFVLLLAPSCSSVPPQEIPEEAKDADGVGGATAKSEVAKWFGKALLQAITNITIQIKVDKNVD